ncbi:response regulator [Larkinella terrae]|uniref:Response regulator n=1 Tax=Larkinella terrae TaxID=2025311 RepID=A0A7K0EJT8_9BACT|nr:response regulator [Larkinella terrae]MRS62099.1 response regulator [Larkinella terrae]
MKKKQRILVVDDEATSRMLLTIQLTRAGYQVIVAGDGLEALKWINTPGHTVDLILLDLMMPRLSGLDVLHFLHSRLGRPPVILMSAAERTIVRQGIVDASPDAFLQKPFSNQRLLDQLQELLPVSNPEMTAQLFQVAQ